MLCPSSSGFKVWGNDIRALAGDLQSIAARKVEFVEAEMSSFLKDQGHLHYVNLGFALTKE